MIMSHDVTLLSKRLQDWSGLASRMYAEVSDTFPKDARGLEGPGSAVGGEGGAAGEPGPRRSQDVSHGRSRSGRSDEGGPLLSLARILSPALAHDEQGKCDAVV